MQELAQLGKPLKVFIVVIIAATFGSLVSIAYLAVSNNNQINAFTNYFTGDTESEISVFEDIPFSSKEVEDGNLEKGISKVTQQGIDGKKKITFRITKDQDGNEINRTIVSEEIINKPVDEIVAIGTKKEESNIASNANNGGSASHNTKPSGSSNNSNSSASNNGNGSNNSNSSSSGNGGWVKAEVSLLYSVCESNVKNKYGKGFYKRGGIGGDSAGHYRPSGYIMIGSSTNEGFNLVECIFETKFDEPMGANGLTGYIKTNTVTIQKWTQVFTLDQIANINY